MWIDDDILNHAAQQITIRCFVPEKTVIVLGASNVAEEEVNLAACAADDVPVFKRYGGGGTVVLHQGCAVVSLGVWVRQHFQNKLYFERLNAALIDSMALFAPSLAELTQRGLSDLALGERKVAGTSLFRSRNYLLYQASILVDPQIELLERYLRHPTREPDYRGGRSHRDFVVGIGELVPGLTAHATVDLMGESLKATLLLRLGDELALPHHDQFAGLYARANSRLATTVK